MTKEEREAIRAAHMEEDEYKSGFIPQAERLHAHRGALLAALDEADKRIAEMEAALGEAIKVIEGTIDTRRCAVADLRRLFRARAALAKKGGGS